MQQQSPNLNFIISQQQSSNLNFINKVQIWTLSSKFKFGLYHQSTTKFKLELYQQSSNLNFIIKVQIWTLSSLNHKVQIWTLMISHATTKSKFELYHQSTTKFKLELYQQSSNLNFDIKVQIWTLTSKFKFELLLWSLNNEVQKRTFSDLSQNSNLNFYDQFNKVNLTFSMPRWNIKFESEWKIENRNCAAGEKMKNLKIAQPTKNSNLRVFSETSFCFSDNNVFRLLIPI